MRDPTERFSDRVENYTKYRPGYPRAVLTALETHCGLNATSHVADIGAGTGIFSALLLESGCRVTAVEPNGPMRRAAEAALGENGRYQSLDASAEKTTLPRQSIDIISAAQAFHWFEPVPTRAEFQRILKPGGWVALVWNRRNAADPFQQAYERLLRQRLPEYGQVTHHRLNQAETRAFVGEAHFKQFTFAHAQRFDFAGLVGRLRSSSYAPTPEQAVYAPLLADLERLFAEYAEAGEVLFAYQTNLYVGKMGGAVDCAHQ